MKQSNRLLRGALAIGAGTALGLGGLVAATPAFATDADQPTEAEVTQLFDANADVQAVGTNAAGGTVVVVSTPQAQATPSAELSAFTAEYEAKVTVAGPIQAYAATDVVGGAGYVAEDGTGTPVSNCSVGFAAWTPEGNPGIVSAGHCTSDGAWPTAQTTDPATQPAITGDRDKNATLTGKLGDFEFSQYGGPGNTEGAQDDNSIDFSAMEVNGPSLNTVPMVADWTAPADLSQSGAKITAVGDVDPNGPVISKSGRTTGHTSAPAANLDISDGWARVSDRVVKGFGVIGLESAPGDSGGAVYQGNTAVGVLSGGAPASDTHPAYTWVADMDKGLELSGYKIALFIDAPVITTPAAAQVAPGSAITGTAPAGTTLVVTDSATGTSTTTTVDGSGNWSFAAPTSPAEFTFTVQAVRDFDKSAVVSSSVVVTPEAVAAPAIVSPGSGASFAADEAPTAVTGTGIDGATVEVSLNGTVVGTSVVAGGNWSVALSQSAARSVDASALQPGEYTISATQTVEGRTSAAATSVFTVLPAGTEPTPTPTESPVETTPITPAPTPGEGGEDDGNLAVTGADGDIALYGGLAAVVLLIAGAAVYATQRRRSLR